MPLVQFFGGPWDGKTKDFPKLEPTYKVRLESESSFGPFPGIVRIPKVDVFEYRRETLSYSICRNLLCEWTMQANIYVHGTRFDATLLRNGILEIGVWNHRFELMPKPDFLTRFEDWFLWTAYYFGAPCREVRSLEHEVFEAMERARRFVQRHYGHEERIKDYIYNCDMVPLRLDPFGFYRYKGKQ